MKPNDVIRLKGISGKGKNRVREHGELWVIRSIASERKAWIEKGALNIEPIEQKQRWPEGRWILPRRDSNFEIVEVIEERIANEC